MLGLRVPTPTPLSSPNPAETIILGHSAFQAVLHSTYDMSLRSVWTSDWSRPNTRELLGGDMKKKERTSGASDETRLCPSDNPNQSSARRQTLRTIIAGGGVVSLAAWKPPIVRSVILPAHAQTSPEPGADLVCDASLSQDFCGGGDEVTNISATVLDNVPDGTQIRMTATLNGGAIPNGAAENPRVRTTTANVASFGSLNVCTASQQGGIPQNSTLTLFFEFVDGGVSTDTCTINFDFNPPPEIFGSATFNNASTIECGSSGDEITNITATTTPPAPGVDVTLLVQFNGGGLPSGDAQASQTVTTDGNGEASFDDVNVCTAGQNVTGTVTLTFGFDNAGVSTDTDTINVSVV